ncbi:hypothetical protein HY768_11130 [candidate division TA06 bacterium]|uniref:Tetratricopeptide repeat protein n=1 Tax=candidate division TA06 bacterium TaxID=2250710 RepID=A0A933IAZ9_UNCT6|nr:hypothetical protein [candidate division TA06 bacterium]
MKITYKCVFFHLIVLLSFSYPLYADRSDKCLDYIQRKYYFTVDSIIRDWEHDSVPDPELFVVKTSYFFSLASSNLLRIDKKVPIGSKAIPIQHKETGEIYYIHDDKAYKPEFVDSAISSVKTGIRLFPHRFDLRFGLAYICQEIGDIKAQVSILSQTVEHAKAYPNSVLWAKNKPIANTDSFLIQSLHSYGLYYYQTEEDEKFGQIAKLHVKYFPHSVIGRNDLGNYYGFKRLWRKALEQYMTAFTGDTTDMLVLNNIAHTYKKLGDNHNTIKYYTKVINNTTDQQVKEQALDGLNSLQKKVPPMKRQNNKP